MDFAPTDTQVAVRAVVGDVLDKDTATWKALAKAGLVGLVAPPELGGEGLGLAELAVVLREVGARACALPVWETLACGVLPVASQGTERQRRALIPEVLAGEALLVPALMESGVGIAATPRTTLREAGGRWLLAGRKLAVSYASEAHRLLVPATLVGAEGPGACVVLLDPAAPGVTLVPTRGSRGPGEATLVLEDVEVDSEDILGGWRNARAAAQALHRVAVAGLCVLGDGLVAGALELTAGYVKQRRQFGRSLAEFQAVSQQIADVYVASRTIGLAATSAAWRLAEGLDADDDLAVAAYWLTAEGLPALHACHHLHGGTGVDVSYPLHRYYAWAKDITRLLGGPEHALDIVADRFVGPAQGGR